MNVGKDKLSCSKCSKSLIADGNTDYLLLAKYRYYSGDGTEKRM